MPTSAMASRKHYLMSLVRSLLNTISHRQRAYWKDHSVPDREAIFPEDGLALYEKHGYSPAIRSGDVLFVSGHVGSLSDGTPEPDYEAQVRLAYENLEATLAAGGCTFDDIVDVTVFHTVPPHQTAEEGRVWAEIRSRVRRERFPHAPFTNITAVGVSWLAGFDFEIKVIARVPSTSSPLPPSSVDPTPR